ncbi:ComEC/Rec2 family competence protein [Vibrio hepatarius]|uniref:ComEC/Rec2 family competence protein n=1 Tax=Vibrio hepatarius TaxID=171383 RepID=UPI003735196C
MSALSKFTRFRAYRLSSKGSSFSYFDSESFTLIEARYNEANKPSIEEELKLCGVDRITCLHITSWDVDHCSPSELSKIMEDLKPSLIQYPGYTPHTDSGKESLRIIKSFERRFKNKNPNSTRKVAVQITPKYITSLKPAKSFKYKDVILHPKKIDLNSPNDNSTVKLFRSGSFNVASLGDVESSSISSYLLNCSSMKKEVDILILAHHGADNGFTTNKFLRVVKPKFAICSSNYDNQYEHPKKEIRELLHEFEIPIFTTKTGDVIISSTGRHVGDYEIKNLISKNEKVSSVKNGISKKKKFLSQNNDTISARSRKPRIR